MDEYAQRLRGTPRTIALTGAESINGLLWALQMGGRPDVDWHSFLAPSGCCFARPPLPREPFGWFTSSLISIIVVIIIIIMIVIVIIIGANATLSSVGRKENSGFIMIVSGGRSRRPNPKFWVGAREKESLLSSFLFHSHAFPPPNAILVSPQNRPT